MSANGQGWPPPKVCCFFGWCMAAWFWIPKPLHSIANPSRRNHPCHSWCRVAAFFIYPKVKRNRIQNGGGKDIGFSFRRVRQALRMPLHRKYGSRKVARLFGRRRSSGVSDFPCLHGNERYGTCDDASTEIASIGLCQPQSNPQPKGVWTSLRGPPLFNVVNLSRHYPLCITDLPVCKTHSLFRDVQISFWSACLDEWLTSFFEFGLWVPLVAFCNSERSTDFSHIGKRCL